LIQRVLQVVDDFLSENVGIGQTVAVFDAFVFDPEQVQAQLVALEQLLILLPFMGSLPISFRFPPLDGDG
jgi:hypothetical protein